MYNFSPIKTKLEEAKSWLQKEYLQISTGRANPALLDSVMVEVYGAKQPIKNIASITMEDPRTLRISPWDKTQVSAIERAITESKLPFSVATDSNGLRASIPQLTSENKEALVKVVKAKLEQARVRVRGDREEALKDMSAQELPEDEEHRTKDELQKLVTKANEELENLFTTKETDILKV